MRVSQRMAAMVIIGGFFVTTPFLRQVVGVKAGWMRQWRMFATFASDLCEVQYLQREGGVDTPVDRLAVLGHPDPRTAPRSATLLTKNGGIERQASELCKKLGPDTDLRADARCASMDGWQVAYTRDRNLCVPAPKKPKEAPAASDDVPEEDL